MQKIPKFVNVKKANLFFEKMAKEFKTEEVVLVKNPEYVYSKFDSYILAPKIEKPLNEIYGIVCDMDGTTTTTETLCLHSLETMVRRITDREDPKIWPGLDHKNDYPHIIGNSTTKHVEYLIKTYSKDIKPQAIKKSYFTAALWTILFGQDEGRKKEVLDNLRIFGISSFLKENSYRDFVNKKKRALRDIKELSELFFNKLQSKFVLKDFNDVVRAAIDIYYYRYHEILSILNLGKGKILSQEIFSNSDKKLIEPMPGVGIYLAAMKGWLGEDLPLFYEAMKKYLINHPRTKYKEKDFSNKEKLLKLGNYFIKNPAKIAIVTSSIYYEANIVLTEVFRVIREQINGWPLSLEKKTALKEKFRDYRNVYDCFVTATDSSETRLKPHRDLYSIALHRLGLKPKDFNQIIGYEDSESGTIAIRAAGIGKCIAVPFKDTAGHDLSAAVHILKGGLPEALLIYNGFLDKKVI